MGSRFESVLVISDTHAPYHHVDAIEFLNAVRKKYRPDKIVHIGDEVDFHALSFHDSDPDLDSVGTELIRARVFIGALASLFPHVDLVESNHGSLVFRKAKAHGLSVHMIKTYNEILGVGPGWKWHQDLTLDLSDGKSVYFHHGKSGDALKTSLNMSMSAVQGHYHGKFGVQYWGNPRGLYWGMQVGCLIDDRALAFAYNKADLPRPIIGTGMIINGQPKLIALVKKANGRWDRRVH